MILELCDISTRDESTYDRSLNPFECHDDDFDETASTTSKSRFSLSDMKLPNVKRFMRRQREKQSNATGGLVLKITTSKMRCSIKVKEEFENDTSENADGINFTICVGMIMNLMCVFSLSFFFLSFKRPDLHQNNSFRARDTFGVMEERHICSNTLIAMGSSAFNDSNSTAQRWRS